jgi:thiol-disulfide isomerase/thioredoxin
MNNLSRKIELLANVAIISVALLIGVAFVRNHLSPAISARPAAPVPVPAGAKLSVPGVDWAQSEKTLVLALNKGCHYCSASASFYQRLARETAGHKDVRLIAVLPQEVSEGKQYLDELKIPIQDIRQASLDSLGVSGTPTLILLDKTGSVTAAWTGQLPADKEPDVLRRLL